MTSPFSKLAVSLCQRLRWLLPLWIFLAPLTYVPATFAYAAGCQTTVTYDSKDQSAIGYDAVSVLATGGKEKATARLRISFVKCASFLAAKQVFTSTDAHVGPTATKLEELFPGRVSGVNRNLPANVAGGTREVDIVTDQFIIQVKKGRASGLASQVQETGATLLDQTRKVVGYAPDNYSSHAWTGAAEQGIPIARNLDELIDIIRELSK